MKRLWLLFPLIFLSACQDSDAFKVGAILVNSITETPEKLPRDRVAAIPYASMGLELGATPEVLLILGTQNAGELDWYAGEDVFIRTRNGRIVRTVGLPYDLGGLREAAQSSSPSVAGNMTQRMQYLLDFPDLGVFGATAECTSREMGPDSIDILGQPLATRHFREHCSVAAMKWNYDNDFWVDTTGFIWRSSQHVHPDSPPVVLEVFRPAQNPG